MNMRTLVVIVVVFVLGYLACKKFPNILPG